jgi:hypothetical protein
LNTAVIAATGITALALFFFLLEWDGMTEGHAKPAAHVLNAARWAFVIALAWYLIPATTNAPAQERAVTMVGLAGLVGALMLIPVGWFIRIGGRDPIWELRRVRVDVTQVTNKIRRDRASVPAERSHDLLERIQHACTPETAELCELLTAELRDVLAGAESWNEAGRRTIRLDEICRRLWGDDLPPPDFDHEEATFRWRLYRTFGQLMDAGVASPKPAARSAFSKRLSSLDDFRRPDTEAFIRDLRRSARRWLDAPAPKPPWIENFDFSVLGPSGLAEIKRLWGQDAALWGAELDEDDRRALEEDRARRAAVVQAPEAESASARESG